MLPGMELMGCHELAVPADLMRHVVRIESSFNPYAIGVVGARLERQPRSLAEAVSTARMLENEGYNFSLGLAQVNRHNLARQGLDSYERAFEACPNVRAGARILADCYRRADQDWGKALSCYYSGNFVTGFRHGYVQKVFASWNGEGTAAVPVQPGGRRIGRAAPAMDPGADALLLRRIQDAATVVPGVADARGPGGTPHRTQPATPPVVASEPDAPVLVQPMQASFPAAAPPPLPHHGAPSADAAFVFEQ